jgi:hypothetical protein
MTVLIQRLAMNNLLNRGTVIEAISCRYIIVLGNVVAGAIWGFSTDIVGVDMSRFPYDVQLR